METLLLKSQILSHSRRLEWIITSFSKYPAMFSIPSKEFKLARSCPYEWLVEISISSETFRISIRRTDRAGHVFPVSGTISFQNSENETYEKVLSSVYVFDNVGHHRESTEIWSSSRPGHSTLDMCDFPISLPDDELIIRCDIAVSNCCILTEELENPKKLDVLKDLSHYSDLLEDLLTMYFEKPQTDILLKVGADFIPCHKFILCSRSPVFRKIIEEDPKVGKFGIITIEDVDALVMDDLLEYLYTNSFQGRSAETLIGLYQVSFRYCMTGLQQRCSERLAKNLSENTCCEVLKLAETIGDDKLKVASSIFITENFCKLKDTQVFGTFVEDNPRLFLQVISNTWGKSLTNSKTI